MKLGLISDIHGNLEALTAVLAWLRGHGASYFACCGDVVGYGPDPAACIETLRELRCPTVAGNHDHGVIGRADTGSFNAAAAEAVLWSRDRVKGDSRVYLEDLPLTAQVGPMLLVHASPSAPTQWEYVFTVREAEEEMRSYPDSVCVVGHSHYPFAVERLPGEPARLVRESNLELRPEAKYFINAGSTGQPRDGDPRACCLLFDYRSRTLAFHRVTYDVAAVQRKIREAGLPEFLASRLASGR
jgi:diadenosine tetraphosphatase ApaH/serine/threonine PP2A family protein phosphatase